MTVVRSTLSFLAIVLVSASLSRCVAQEGTAATKPTAPAAPPAVDGTTLQAAVTATKKEDQDFGNAVALLQDFTKYTNAMKNITVPALRSTAPDLEDMQNLQAIVIGIQRSKLVERATSAKDLLDPKSGSDDDKRKAACDALPQDSNGQSKDVTAALANCSRIEKEAQARFNDLGTALSTLVETLATIPPFVKKNIDSMQEKLKPFSKLTTKKDGTAIDPDSITLLQVLPNGLPALRQVLEGCVGNRAAWDGMKTSLATTTDKDALTKLEANITATNTAFETLQNTINEILPKLEKWCQSIQSAELAAAKNLDGQISEVQSDPAKNSATAVGAVREQGDTLASAQAVVDAWPPLVGFLADGEPSGFKLPTTKTAFESLKKETNVLRGSVACMHDALAGNAENFETDQVSLYYFTDVNRLMHALNENVQTLGGVAEAQANAAAQRTSLTQAELELSDALANVNRYQKQVVDLQEQQRQMQSSLKGLNGNLSKLGSRLNHSQADKQNADANYNAVQGEEDSDPSKAASLAKAKAKQDSAATKLSNSQSDYDAAKTERDNAQQKMDESQNQSDSIPSKLAAARQALSEAQSAVSQQRRKALMAAQAESDAFAFARDNTPYLYAPAVAASSDPAKRVILYAFNDSKTIFMRGPAKDLDVVKGVIAKFDQPAPQARLTLWTMELSADAEQKTNARSADRLNRAMQIVDEELSNARAQVNSTLSLFRELINNRVQAVEQAYAAENPLTGASDNAKWRRAHFYDRSVLDRLGINLSQADLETLRNRVPDPSGTTTLGEALMILDLAPTATKECIHQAFDAQIKSRLGAAPMIFQVDDKMKDKKRQDSLGDTVGTNPLFLTWQALGALGGPAISCDAVPVVGSGLLTSSQLEITRALKTGVEAKQRNWQIRELGQIHGELKSLFSDEEDVQERLINVQTEQKKLTSLVGSAANKLTPLQRDQLHTYALDEERMKARLNNIKSLTVQPTDVARRYNIQPRGGTSADHQGFLKSIAQVRSNLLSFQSLNAPRVAAADQMLKELMIAVEDDLDRLYIQPMLARLRYRLVTQQNLRVGIVQRESVLATNRGVARVDPHATANLAVGEEQDILSGVQQLAQLYAAVQSGGALAALGALDQQPREQAPEIYALTTGNRFQVTPIFDPSGQALRFKFDFVGSSKLQEPNGTTNPQFPRIERHTVNTEVQLSNLETREISRFESDAKLGLPTTYWGGVPILKDIPHFRPWVPFLGWFVRKAGSNASAQQSVIFGQTTIYPTIQSMVDLLVQPEDSSAH